MHLSPAQLTTLKTHIQGNGDTNALYIAGDLSGLAALLNLAAAGPNNVVWKTNVSISAVGDAVNGAELAGLTSLNNTRLQTLVQLSANGLNPSLGNRRQFFDDIFSGAGGVTTRASLLSLWKRTATRFEKLFATGTGSDASPATLVVEGALNYAELIGL